MAVGGGRIAACGHTLIWPAIAFELHPTDIIIISQATNLLSTQTLL